MKGATVLVFATQAEARPLLDTFGGDPLRDTALQLHQLDDALLLVCGSGSAAAGAAIDALATQFRPRRVVLGGMARRLHERLPVGGIAQVGAAAFERPQRTTYVPVTRLAATDLADAHGDCTLLSRATPPLDGSERARLALFADLMDGEGAAVASACVQHGIECAMYKVIGDYSGARPLSAGMSAELNARLAGFMLRHYARLIDGVEPRVPRAKAEPPLSAALAAVARTGS